MPGTDASTDRRLDLDWIRIVAVLLLIPFHSARVFDIWEDFYVKNADLSAALGYAVVGFIGAWQMQILFLVAGASTWYALGFRGGGQYLGERVKRLLVPFVFGTLVIVPPQMYFALLQRGKTIESYLGYLPRFFEIRPADLADYTGIGLSWAHLWFILDLFVISLVVLPLLLWVKRGSGQRLVGWLARRAEHRWTIFLWFLPLPFFGELPEIDSKPFFVFVLLFGYGFVLMADERLGRAEYGHRWTALALAVVTMGLLYTVALTGTRVEDGSALDVAVWQLRGLNLWCWLVAILGLGRQFLSADSGLLRYAREGAYPFYLLHQTVIVALGFVVVQWALPVLPKFLALVVCSFVVTVALYDVVVRRTNVTRFLFGMRAKASAARGRAAVAGAEKTSV